MVYLYYGENDFAIDAQVQGVKQAFAQKYSGTAIEQLDGAEIETAELLRKAVGVDMFTPRKLLIVKHTAKKPAIWAKLAESLVQVPDSTDLVLVEGKVDQRLKATKEIKKVAKVREFKKLTPWELQSWVKQALQESRLEVKSGAVEALIQACGGDQWRIRTEIAKLAKLGQVLTADLVQKYVEADALGDSFRVLELAFAQKKADMNAELAKLRDSESAEKFFGLIASQMFALAAAQQAGERSSGVVAEELGIHPFVMQKIFTIARGITEEETKKLVQALAETDAKMKLGGDGWTLLSLWLNRL